MMLELSLTNLIFICIAIFSGVWALLKAMAVMFTRSQQIQNALVNERMDELNKILKEEASQWHRIERELLVLKAEMPVHYVRREDYVQAVASILVKLDAAQMRHENLLLKGLRHHE